MFVLIYKQRREAFYFTERQDLLEWLTEMAATDPNVGDRTSVHELSDKTKRRVIIKPIEVQVVQ